MPSAALQGALRGIRVLALEQAVALPIATRHLADLGAEVIRVQSYERARPADPSSIELTRSKQQVGLNLAAEGGPELFLRLAAACDVVAHNFTPRVVRKFGVDFEGVRAVNEDVIYVSLTGFGTTGPWGERPLFGPGAEAVSGHNLLIGDPEAWPGRPGTGVYADDTCGLYATMAILAALDERERTGAGQHIDISLYETMVAHLGPVLAERARGAEPDRVSNADHRYAIHDVFDARGLDRHVAVAAREDQLPALARALGIDIPTTEAVASAIALLDDADAEQRLQAAGIAASSVADASDNLTDGHLWARGYFGLRADPPDAGTSLYPHPSAFWGGDNGTVEGPRHVGADNDAVLSAVAGLTPDEIARLRETGAIGVAEPAPARRANSDLGLRIERGELSRVDAETPDWRSFAEA
jgi:crotonobetainyl-CoA:carnitine CoA-transferase CaiB-like acyl-CoA transferase